MKGLKLDEEFFYNPGRILLGDFGQRDSAQKISVQENSVKEKLDSIPINKNIYQLQ